MLLPQDGVDGLQEVLPALWRAWKENKAGEQKRKVFSWSRQTCTRCINLLEEFHEAHLQHSWKVLSGRPSDSDFVWTISHTEEPSPSEVGKEVEISNTHLYLSHLILAT